MKGLLSILAIVSFIAVAVFGFSAMNPHLGHNPHQICVATIVQGFECPVGVNLADFHINAFKIFSSAVFSSYLLIILLTIFLGSGNLMLFSNRHFANFLKIKEQTSFQPLCDRDLTSWLSLHENSPAVA